MPNERERTRPEAGADTDPEGKNPRPAQSGGQRSAAGSTYGDYVPDRARSNDDRDADEPLSPSAPQSAEESATGPDADNREAAESDEERVVEDKRNKSFDTTHVHSGTTSRKV